MIKAGAKKYPGVKKSPKYSYRDIYFDPGKWADASRFLPEDYDLVLMRLTNGKTITGWSVGLKWEGLRLQPEDNVKYWKRKLDQM